MIDPATIRQLVEQQLEGTPHFLVDVEVRPGNVVIIEVDNDQAIKLNDLALINRGLRDRIDALGEDVELQVGSPGMGRPFKVMRQYQKHTGRVVEVLLRDGRRLSGLLEGADEQGIRLRVQHPAKTKGRAPQMDAEATSLPFADIKSTQSTISFN
ncbi:MAG: hypothetical protein JNM31_02870 [Flavobacteriales bacterium]|nr:hypothetical protein [Flavobacteriales bacterium]